MQRNTSSYVSLRRSAMIAPEIIRGAQPRVPLPRLLDACLAGFLGTVGHTLVCYSAPFIGMPRVNINGILGSPLFSSWIPPAFSGSWLAGLGVHFFLGAILFPAAYILVAHKRLPGSMMMRSMLWAGLLWLVGQTVVMPLLGMGSLFQHLPEAVITYLLAHVAYGAIFGALLSKRARAIY